MKPMTRRRYVDPENFTRVNELRLDGKTYKEIAEKTKIPISTCWRYCNPKIRHDPIKSNYKRCWGCDQVLPLSKFYKSNTGSKGVQSQCKKCQVKYNRNREKNYASDKTEYSRKWYRKYKDNVLLKLSPNGTPKCAICKFSSDSRLLHIDHINNDGAEEKRRIGGPSAIYTLINNLSVEEARKRYRLLCAFHSWADRFDDFNGKDYIVIKRSEMV